MVRNPQGQTGSALLVRMSVAEVPDGSCLQAKRKGTQTVVDNTLVRFGKFINRNRIKTLDLTQTALLVDP